MFVSNEHGNRFAERDYIKSCHQAGAALPWLATASIFALICASSPREERRLDRTSRSSSDTRGWRLGMVSSTMSASDTPSRYFTNARRLLPCAAIMTLLPERIVGAIAECQEGRKRATVSLRHSVRGN